MVSGVWLVTRYWAKGDATLLYQIDLSEPEYLKLTRACLSLSFKISVYVISWVSIFLIFKLWMIRNI